MWSSMKRLAAKVWHWLAELHLVAWLIEKALSLKELFVGDLGIWSGFFAFGYTALVGVVAISANNLLAALIGAPIAGAAFLLCWRLWLTSRTPKPQKDLTKWRNHHTYSVWVAAALWIEMEPWPAIPADSPAYAPLQKIKGALETDQIKSTDGSKNMKAKVTREELMKLANSHGERPKFLFPDQ